MYVPLLKESVTQEDYGTIETVGLLASHLLFKSPYTFSQRAHRSALRQLCLVDCLLREEQSDKPCLLLRLNGLL